MWYYVCYEIVLLLFIRKNIRYNKSISKWNSSSSFSLIVFVLQSESLCKSHSLSSSDSETIAKTSPGLDSIPLSEIDKAAVLTLIREEVTLKHLPCVQIYCPEICLSHYAVCVNTLNDKQTKYIVFKYIFYFNNCNNYYFKDFLLLNLL